MLLVLDIGNTSITIGIYKDEILIHTSKLSSDKFKTKKDYEIILNNFIKQEILYNGFKAAVISSVVPLLTEKLKIAVQKCFKIPVLIVSSSINAGINLDVEKSVGCDRIANACAAYKLYGSPSIVVDLGTATTFDVVLNDGKFIGGAISPGIEISAKSLSSFTSLLPKINITPPASVIGKNTINSMLSGIIIGHAAMVEGIILRIEEELGFKTTKIATGGYSNIIDDYLKYP
ncbi:MAG: type III pantothenate kinase, partial [bacterium]